MSTVAGDERRRQDHRRRTTSRCAELQVAGDDRSCRGSGIGTDVHPIEPGAPAGSPASSGPAPTAAPGTPTATSSRTRSPTRVLSAAGLGDIGGLLGTDDPRWAGASRRRRPRARPRRARRRRLAGRQRVRPADRRPPRSWVRAGPRPRRCCRRPWARRSASRATTTDGLGLTGRGEGRAAVATALVVRNPRARALRRLPAVSLRLYDTAARAVRDFTPLRAGRASVYVCGLTVQGPPHVGHVRAALAFDVLRRWLTAERARRHLRPQRHRHRRQDPRQVRRARRPVVGLGVRERARRAPAPTTSSASCRPPTSRGPPATSPR